MVNQPVWWNVAVSVGLLTEFRCYSGIVQATSELLQIGVQLRVSQIYTR